MRAAVMKQQPPERDAGSRFHGRLRHYHRAGVPKTQSWDEWVHGKKSSSWSLRKWLKFAALVLSLLALAGIITGLIIELR